MQAGQIKKRGASWVLRYWETVLLPDGKTEQRRRVLKRLGPIENGDRVPPPEIKNEAKRILTPINSGTARPTSAQTLASFVNDVYLPFVEANKKPSTYMSYKIAWALITPHLDGQQLRSFRVSHIDTLLQDVAAPRRRAQTTLRNVRNFLSGAFRYALRRDLVSTNPVRDAEVPKGLPKGETPAYTLDEIQKLLRTLPAGRSRTAVAVISFTGLRVSELKGLQWTDWVGNELHVRRSVWSGHITETKTRHSAAPVPVLPIVEKALKAHRAEASADCAYIFAGQRSRKPLRLENVVRREIKPALARAGIQWRGWHAFRRGLATNLHALGVDDLTIQRILRHGNVAVTQAAYIKTVPKQASAALRKLEKAFKARRKK